MKFFPLLLLTIAIALPAANAPAQSIPVTITVNTAQDVHPISPLIYGLNAYVFDSRWKSAIDWRTGLDNHASGLNAGSRRLGGNTMTSYNWENGFSNSGDDGSDHDHANNEYQSFITGAGDAPYAPGAALTTFHGHSLSLGAYSLLQLPAAGYVAADGNGPVTPAEAAPSSRWKKVVFDKPGSPGSLSLAPDLNDDAVYVDEEMNFLIARYGSAATANGIKGYELDNEPGLWHHYPSNGLEGTHPRMHPGLLTCGELLERNIALAQTIRRVDPAATIYGPAMWGYSEFHSLWGVYDGVMHQPSDWGSYDIEPYRTGNSGDELRYNRMTWVNAYLDHMKRASDAAGKRLLDRFSVHYYPDNEAADTPVKIVQATRSLWDPAFTETSWITKDGNGFTDGHPLELIPKLQRSIADFYPGTGLAITEYSFGGRGLAAGGIAQADALGIFGRYGVQLATYFFTVDEFIASAFKIYRNYDGTNSAFGDTAVRAVTSDDAASSAYASLDSTGNLHLIVINRNLTSPLLSSVRFESPGPWKSGTIYAFGGSDRAITKRGTIAVDAAGFSWELPPATVAHFVLTKSTPLSAMTSAESREASIAIAPNPTRGDGKIMITLPHPGTFSARLYDGLGREAAMLAEGYHAGGSFTVDFHGDHLPTGSYTLRLFSGETVRNARVLLVR